jgi:hypothetical protein
MVTSGPTRDQPEPIASHSANSAQTQQTPTVNDNIPLWVWLMPVPLLFVAILKLPYGYYTFTRLVVMLSSGFIVWRLWNSRTIAQVILTALFSLTCVLFNPIIPIRLSRTEWPLIDAAAALCFSLGWLITQRPFRALMAHRQPVRAPTRNQKPWIVDAQGNVIAPKKLNANRSKQESRLN